MRTEGDPKVLGVLERALVSSSRATRVRAVAMLEMVECDQREDWLERACHDRDHSVRQTAEAVSSWVRTVEHVPWPAREELSERALSDGGGSSSGAESLAGAPGTGWRWEYAIEVWRSDALLIGVFLATSFDEDDEHAKRIAVGQAILASAAPLGDPFDPSTAAAFIVGKKRAPIAGPSHPFGPVGDHF